MSEVVLYQYPGSQGVPSLSPPCAKVFLALRYTGREHRVVNLKDPRQVKKVSPTGRVPAIEHDGRVLSDSIRILDYLEEASGAARRLGPEDPAARAQDRVWEHFANEALYWPLVYQRWLVPSNLRKTVAGMRMGGAVMQALVRTFGRRETLRRARGQGIGNKSPEVVADDLARCLAVAADGLAGGPYLAGRDAPGRGDLALATITSQLGWEGATPEGDAALRGLPALREHARACYAACDAPAPAWLSD